MMIIDQQLIAIAIIININRACCSPSLVARVKVTGVFVFIMFVCFLYR